MVIASTNGRTLPTTRLENNAEYIATVIGVPPAGTVIGYVLVTTAGSGIEHRPIHKYGTRDGIDLANFPDARLFVRRTSSKKAVYDELNRVAMDAISAIDYRTGFVRTPIILATEQGGAFPGYVKLATGLVSRETWEADKRARLAAAGVTVPEPTPATEPAAEPAPIAAEPVPTPATEPAAEPVATEPATKRKGGRRKRSA